MVFFRCLVILGGLFLLAACSVPEKNSRHEAVSDELLQFARANCMFWYFKKNGYDLRDIRAVSGGMVETGSYSAEVYQNISLFLRDYSPSQSSKQNIDVDLLKCFRLDRDQVVLDKLREF